MHYVKHMRLSSFACLVWYNRLPAYFASAKVFLILFPFLVSISLVIMVFVNYGGGRYWFFRHESWNGEFHLVLLF